MDSTVYKKIESYLMDIITQNASVPDYKLPSERMLSMTFNASRKPVRHAYSQLISKGYVTNIHGKGYFISNYIHRQAPVLAARSSPSISLIIPSILSQFSHGILTGVSDFCSSHHVELAIHISDDSPEKEVHLLRTVPNSGAKGIILFPLGHKTACHDELHKLSIRKYPLVLVDRTVANIHASFISSNNHQAMVDAVEFLHRYGFQNIVYITPPSEDASSTDARINGFNHGLLRYYKMVTPKNLLILEGSFQQQKDTVVKYLTAYPDTQIVIVSGLQRLCVISAAQELGIRIPQNMRLMIFDDELSPSERYLLKPYIVRQDGYQIGYLAAEALHNQIYGDLRTVTRQLPVSIIDTGSDDI